MRIGFEVVGRGAQRSARGAVLALAVGAALTAFAACGGDDARASADGTSRTNGSTAEKVAGDGGAPSAAGAERGRVLFLGTSLTAGLGLDPSEAYPAVIAEKIDSAGLPFDVVNA